MVEEKWSVARGQRDELPIIYRYRTTVDKTIKPSDYPTLIVISWLYEGKNQHGFPDSDTNKAQQLLEDLLDELDTPEISFLTQVVTCNGTKEWLWYVKDSDDWMDKLNESLAQAEAFPININFYDEPQWETYNGFINWINQTKNEIENSKLNGVKF